MELGVDVNHSGELLDTLFNLFLAGELVELILGYEGPVSVFALVLCQLDVIIIVFFQLLLDLHDNFQLFLFELDLVPQLPQEDLALDANFPRLGCLGGLALRRLLRWLYGRDRGSAALPAVAPQVADALDLAGTAPALDRHQLLLLPGVRHYKPPLQLFLVDLFLSVVRRVRGVLRLPGYYLLLRHVVRSARLVEGGILRLLISTREVGVPRRTRSSVLRGRSLVELVFPHPIFVMYDLDLILLELVLAHFLNIFE